MIRDPGNDYSMEYGGLFSLLIGDMADARRPRPKPPVSALTGKQHLVRPSSNRKAALLAKALERSKATQ